MCMFGDCTLPESFLLYPSNKIFAPPLARFFNKYTETYGTTPNPTLCFCLCLSLSHTQNAPLLVMLWAFLRACLFKIVCSFLLQRQSVPSKRPWLAFHVNICMDFQLFQEVLLLDQIDVFVRFCSHFRIKWCLWVFSVNKQFVIETGTMSCLQ